MLNPLRLAGKAVGVGAGLAGAAVKAVGGAMGRSDTPEEERTSERPPPERRPAKPSITDGALADKVESVLFSDPTVPKGKIDINAVGRDVYLRGEAKTPDMIKTLERRARAIPEVNQVENLLHLPKTPAPTRADTPKRAQKSRRTKGTAAARKRTPKRVNAEAKATVGETPKEMAAKGEGRKPAQMGSQQEKDNGSGPKATETKTAKPASAKATETRAAKPASAKASSKADKKAGPKPKTT